MRQKRTYLGKNGKNEGFSFLFLFESEISIHNENEKIKSKKIGRLRKGARENSKIPQSFLFRISLNKKRQQESEYKQTNNQTLSLI